MPTLEPGQALFACENALRELFTHVYEQQYGPRWMERISTPEQRATWTARAQAEGHRAQRGVVSSAANGLYFAEFYELISIADKHWSALAPALGKKASTMPLLERFERLRNPVGHTRQLFAFEQDLYSGIAGTIRNQVTIFMSTQDSAGEYYPRITAAWDSFGNRIVARGEKGEIAGRHNSDLVLRPGDIVSFTLIATDPQDRDVEWDFYGDGSEMTSQVVASGAEATFTWTISDGSVKEHSVAHFYMRCTGSPYHRANGFDQRVFFTYVVRPPLG